MVSIQQLLAIFYIIILFVFSNCYSYFVFSSDKHNDKFIIFLYVFTLIFLFFVNLLFIIKSKAEQNAHYIYTACMAVISIYSGILIAFYYVNPGNDLLWVIDSYQMHIPGSVNIMNFILGEESIRETSNAWDKIYFTHIVVGIFFSIFGVNPIVSSVVMMIAKLGTILVIFSLGKKIFNERIAAIAVLVYSLMPTVLFYTISFYKEAIIELIVAVIIHSSYSVINEKRKFRHIVTLVISLLLIANERFYLFPILMFSILMYYILNKEIKMRFKILIVIFSVITSFYLYNLYSTVVNLRDIFQVIKGFRESYNSLEDVKESNMNLPYVLGFIKFIFTPFFTLNKFELYNDLSYLIIWGAIPNQIIIVFSLFGMYRSVKENIKKHWIILFPFLIFLCLFAYVSPYNGRLRDSFYSVIAIYAAYGISLLFKPEKKNNY